MATLMHALLPGKFEYGKEKLRIKKYPDTCGQGLTVCPGTLKINRPITGQVQTKESVIDSSIASQIFLLISVLVGPVEFISLQQS